MAVKMLLLFESHDLTFLKRRLAFGERWLSFVGLGKRLLVYPAKRYGLFGVFHADKSSGFTHRDDLLFE